MKLFSQQSGKQKCRPIFIVLPYSSSMCNWTLVGCYWTYMVKTRKWGGASNPTAAQRLMNINEVTRRSTNKIQQRHHRASKPGSVQAEESRTEWTELLQLFVPLGIFYGVFKINKQCRLYIKPGSFFLPGKRRQRRGERWDCICMVTNFTIVTVTALNTDVMMPVCYTNA